MHASLSPQSSCNASRRYVLPALLAFALLLVAGCTAGPAPQGGERPDFADVPERPAVVLAPAERRAVIDNLEVDRGEASEARGIVAARLGRIDAPPASPVLPTAPITGVLASPPLLPPVPPLIGDDLVTADGLVELADAARRDRVLLARRLELGDPPAEPEPAPLVVTALVFSPASATLAPLERARLTGGLAAAGRTGRWEVVVHGEPELVEARGRAIVDAMVGAGLAEPAITVLTGERPVDLAELRVRR